LFVADTISISEEVQKNNKISVVTASDIFSEAIQRTFNNESISSLFDVDKG
jgi:phosphoribosylpyrophosphate synthetase